MAQAIIQPQPVDGDFDDAVDPTSTWSLKDTTKSNMIYFIS
jgi:hypothetical protein